jgi:hypothetical protein
MLGVLSQATLRAVGGPLITRVFTGGRVVSIVTNFAIARKISGAMVDSFLMPLRITGCSYLWCQDLGNDTTCIA